jgi:hypothetical protein
MFKYPWRLVSYAQRFVGWRNASRVIVAVDPIYRNVHTEFTMKVMRLGPRPNF